LNILDLRKFNNFNIEKIIQVLAYIQKRIDCRNKLKLIKLLFFADRINLRKGYGFISFDIYYALKNGPAASKTLNIINKYEDYLDMTPDNIKLYDKIQIINKNDRIIEETKTSYISEVEMSALDEVCKIFGRFTVDELIEITHDYPEWKRYEESFNAGITDSELIVVGDFFENPDVKKSPAFTKYFNGIDPLYTDPGLLSILKEVYLESEVIKLAYR
jgi:uncharacterized phage-associated protein